MGRLSPGPKPVPLLAAPRPREVCDRCSAEALYIITLKSDIPRLLVLFLCGHHTQEHRKELLARGHSVSLLD